MSRDNRYVLLFLIMYWDITNHGIGLLCTSTTILYFMTRFWCILEMKFEIFHDLFIKCTDLSILGNMFSVCLNSYYLGLLIIAAWYVNKSFPFPLHPFVSMTQTHEICPLSSSTDQLAQLRGILQDCPSLIFFSHNEHSCVFCFYFFFLFATSMLSEGNSQGEKATQVIESQ